jgi:hypothetical protein
VQRVPEDRAGHVGGPSRTRGKTSPGSSAVPRRGGTGVKLGRSKNLQRLRDTARTEVGVDNNHKALAEFLKSLPRPRTGVCRRSGRYPRRRTRRTQLSEAAATEQGSSGAAARHCTNHHRTPARTTERSLPGAVRVTGRALTGRRAWFSSDIPFLHQISVGSEISVVPSKLNCYK